MGSEEPVTVAGMAEMVHLKAQYYILIIIIIYSYFGRHGTS